MSGASSLIRKRDAAQAALDAFQGQSLVWGKRDCLKLAVGHLRSLGHQIGLAKAGSYKTALGARRALRKAGYRSLIEAVDSRGLERIAPAAMVAGDLAALPGDNGFAALAIAVGNGRLLAFHPDGGGSDVMAAVVVQPIAFVAAWRVDVRN